MSLPDRRSGSPWRRLRLAACVLSIVALSAVSACTVRPLYSDNTSSVGEASGAVAGLNAIAIKPVNTRYGQELRNHLIFLLNGGAGQPADALYAMDLTVSSYVQSAASIQVNNEDRPTAGSVQMTASYTLKDIATNEVVASGKRSMSSSFDRSSQQFAAARAQRDAENRAARELAELIRLDVGQRLASR